jgi:hypothetical protein
VLSEDKKMEKNVRTSNSAIRGTKMKQAMFSFSRKIEFQMQICVCFSEFRAGLKLIDNTRDYTI